MRVTGVALSKSPPLFLLSPLQLSVVCGRRGGSLPCMWKKAFFLFHQDLFPQRQQSLSVKPRSPSLQHSEAQDILLWLSAGGLNSRSCFQMPWSPAVLNAGSKLKIFLPFFFFFLASSRPFFTFALRSVSGITVLPWEQVRQPPREPLGPKTLSASLFTHCSMCWWLLPVE